MTNKQTFTYIEAMKLVIFVALLLCSTLSFGQKQSLKENSFFGFNYKPLIPFGIVGDAPFTLGDNQFSTDVKTKLGYSFGGLVRTRITKLLALETGLLYTRRNYDFQFSQLDSNIVASNDLGLVNFDIPINALVFIQLSDNIYANTMLGISLNFNPSNVRSRIVPFGKHEFIVEGRRGGYFSIDINASVGFEFRTRKEGTFYMGVASKIPINPIFQVVSVYRNDTYSLQSRGDVTGSTFSFDFKYFFHNVENKGWQFKGGPIEQ